MCKCIRTHSLFPPTHGNFETQITLCDRQSGIERSATDQPLSVIHHCCLSLTLVQMWVCVARGAYEKCVLNQCLSVVWNKTVNSSSPYKGEIIFFHAHLALSLSHSIALCSFSPLLLSIWLPGDFVINSTQLSGTLCPEFPLTVTPFSLNLHL